MKIKLDLEDVRFATTMIEQIGEIRWMVVKIGEKKFYVQRQMDSYRTHFNDEAYRAEIDKFLISEMELILSKVVKDACGAVPEGVELLK